MTTKPSSRRRVLRLGPMLSGMGLVLAILAAGALASASPRDTDALDCDGGAVQVFQFDGALQPASPGTQLATPGEATAAAHQATEDFVHLALPGLRVDEVVEAPAGAAAIDGPTGRAGVDTDTPDATMAAKTGGEVNVVVTLNRDASGHRWAVDRATLCASTAATTEAAPGPVGAR